MVSPKNQTTPIGLTAVFKCQHTNYAIIWRVNGESLAGNHTHLPGTVRDGGSVTYTLNISAQPEFNGSDVECLIVSGRNKGKNAKLLVQG